MAAPVARRTIDSVRAGGSKPFHVFGASSATGLLARALGDPKLYEQSILIHSPEPNGLQANDIAEQYLICGDSAGALRWLGLPRGENVQTERLDLLDRAYELSGDRDRQTAVLIWRALIDAILARGYAKAYGRAARYLLELRALSASIEDYRGHLSHESYERTLQQAHRRKASFWGRLSSTSVQD